MKIKNVKLEWYVLRYDFNSNKIFKYNVFGQNFIDNLYKEISKKRITNWNELKEWIDGEFMYHYWSKAEYEIVVGGLFSKSEDDFTKIDVYTQLKMNLDRIVEYVNRELDIGFERRQ